MPTSTYLDLITLAAAELNLNQLGRAVAPPLDQYLLDRLVMMVDSWNLVPTLIPWYQRQIFTLVPGQQDYLIGPNAPDWAAPRPIRLDPDCCNLLMGSPLPTTTGGFNINAAQIQGPDIGVNGSVSLGNYYAFQINAANVSISPPLPATAYANVSRSSLTVLTVQQWANISGPYTTGFPSGIYLDRSVAVGSNFGSPYTASRISLWGIPDTAWGVELFYWYALTVGNLADNVNAPPGYFRALFLNLAVEVAAGFGIQVPVSTQRNAVDALGDIKDLNAPDMTAICDPGMPGTYSGWVSKAQFISGDF
jgi:hypothetical protein